MNADLKTYSLRLATYRVVNKSHTQYGYARLDAFGRIYNQVLQYVMSTDDIRRRPRTNSSPRARSRRPI